MSEPKRLIDETDSPLERLVLQAGSHAPGGDRLRGKVLVALGVGAAVASTSKTSLAMAAGWKQAIVVGALSCVGVASVVGYRHLSQSASQPVTVVASSGGQNAGAANDRESKGDAVQIDNPAQVDTPAQAHASKSEISKTETAQGALVGAEVGAKGPANVEGAAPSHEGPAAGERAPSHLEPGTEAAGEAESQSTQGPRSNVHVRPAHRGGVKRGGRAEPSGASASARPASGANAAAISSGQSARVERSAAERSQPERTAAGLGATEVAPTAPPSTLEQELAVLDAARGALAAGRWGDAQRHLSDYAKRFPRGKLGLEAEVLRIEALASSGDVEGASRRASAILKRSPNSVVAARLRRFVRE